MKTMVICALCYLVAGVQCKLDGRPFFSGRHLTATCARFRGTDWGGGDCQDTPITDTNDADECCATCNDKFPNCVGYIFRVQQRHCWCKCSINPPSPCDDCFGQNAAEPRVRATYGFDRFGGDLSGPHSLDNPVSCLSLCQSTQGCIAWVWRRDRNHCWLKATETDIEECPACIIGNP